MKKRVSIITAIGLALAVGAGMTGCSSVSALAQYALHNKATASTSSSEVEAQAQVQTTSETTDTQAAQPGTKIDTNTQPSTTPQGNGMDTQPGQTTDKGFTANDNGKAITATLNVDEAFTETDLKQDVDTSSAEKLTLADGEDFTISAEGIYVISGSAKEASIIIDAPDTAKVHLVLDNVTMTNVDAPAIYVKSADKVFVTLQGTNTLSVTGSFTADGTTKTDAVIFSKDDLCLKGTGTLKISSSANAITSKDDLKVTGGTYDITCQGDGFEANDSLRIAAGTFTINAQNNALQCKNDDDNELGYVYIKDGTFKITAADNGIQGYAFVRIDGGIFDIEGEECIEGTYVQINGGTITINANDDAINASIKSSVYTPTIDITGGEINVTMASGDTDALDSNGYIYISGGKVNITAQSAFDYAWGAHMTGGEVTVNGEKITEITNSMMGGGFGEGLEGGFEHQGPEGDFGERPYGKHGHGHGQWGYDQNNQSTQEQSGQQDVANEQNTAAIAKEGNSVTA